MNIHPTAIISSEAKLAEDVTVGPYAVIEGPVVVGAGCAIHAHAKLRGPLVMGARNVVHSFAALGDWPQDRKFKGAFSETIIGDDNIFREHVTVHRGTMEGSRTVLGNRIYMMVGAHVGHNCVVSDDVMMVNWAALAGHVQVGRGAILGAHTAIHQFCRVGRLAMISNNACYNMDLPPFFIAMSINTLTQLNGVGLRRSGMGPASINGLRKMFKMAFRENRGKPLRMALADLPAEVRAVPEVKEMEEFVATSKRGVGRFVEWSKRKEEEIRSEEEGAEG